MLNQDGIRQTLIHIDNCSHKEGFHKFKVKHHLKDPELSELTQDELGEIVHYLVDANLVIVAQKPKKHAYNYHILRLSPEGQKLLSAISNDTTWRQIKKHIANIAEATLAQILAIAANKLT